MNRQLLRILVAFLLFLGAEVLKSAAPWAAPLVLIPYFLVGWEVLWKALQNLLHGELLDENFLMALATVGALAIGRYDEAVFVMLFYQLGEFFQDAALEKSRASIASLMDLRPELAHVLGEDGSVTDCSPEEVAVGARVLVKPGEKLPLDGLVRSGRSALNTAALTGESLPRPVEEGDSVLGGCVNGPGLLQIEVTAPSGESTVSRILALMEEATEKKARTEQFISRFAHWYTPTVVLAALALFLLPSLALLLGAESAFLAGTSWQDWLYRSLNFLVISCPCALVISVPLSFFGGLGACSRQGVLVKGSSYLERLAQVETLVFDKTGTLTKGRFTISHVAPAPGFSKAQLLELAALGEQWSDHPLALALKAGAQVDVAAHQVESLQEEAGHGLRAKVDGKDLLLGSARLLQKAGIPLPEGETEAATMVYLALEGRYAGAIALEDLPKAGTAEALHALKNAGVKHFVMLSGDREEVAQALGRQLGMEEVHGGLLPQEKLSWVERLLQEKPGTLSFVGDGVNDAPVLARADLGVAMGAMGSGAAIEAADVVLMDDDPRKLPLAMNIARKTRRIVKENIAFALGVKALVLLLGALGRSELYMAVFADVGVAVLATLNAMRCLKTQALPIDPMENPAER